MKKVIYLLIFIVLLSLNYVLCSTYDISFNTWKGIQWINFGVFIPMIPILYFGFKKAPNSIGFIFMFSLTVSIVAFKFLAEKNLEEVDIDKNQKLILVSSFLLYITVFVFFLIDELKKIEFNSKKR